MSRFLRAFGYSFAAGVERESSGAKGFDSFMGGLDGKEFRALDQCLGQNPGSPYPQSVESPPEVLTFLHGIVIWHSSLFLISIRIWKIA
jgi:hypothetical protein